LRVARRIVATVADNLESMNWDDVFDISFRDR